MGAFYAGGGAVAFGGFANELVPQKPDFARFVVVVLALFVGSTFNILICFVALLDVASQVERKYCTQKNWANCRPIIFFLLLLVLGYGEIAIAIKQLQNMQS